MKNTDLYKAAKKVIKARQYQLASGTPKQLGENALIEALASLANAIAKTGSEK